ncbi:LOW QUALITY PROTEIN: hypothetical protein HID58_002329, partial [Brassica napus]
MRHCIRKKCASSNKCINICPLLIPRRSAHDVIDCSVQMSGDSIPICLSSIDLGNITTVSQYPISFEKPVPEISSVSGTYTFSITWSEIQSLTRKSLFKSYISILGSVFRFLSSSTWQITPPLLTYLREKQGLDVVKAVLDTLTETGYSNSITTKVIIQSTNSSLTSRSRADRRLCTKLKKPPASAVVIGKSSVFPEIDGFVTGQTNVVERLQKSQLPVYVELFQNEFVSQPFDFFSEATIEINSYVTGPGINGIMTEFPFKAERYRKMKLQPRFSQMLMSLGHHYLRLHQPLHQHLVDKPESLFLFSF